MWLPTLCAGLLQIILLVLIFNKKLKQPLEITKEEFHIDSKLDLFVGVITLVTCLIFLVISSYIDMEMWLISFIAASSLIIVVLLIRLITHKHWEYLTSSLKRLPYQLIPFLLSMFVIVLALNYQGISSKLGEVLNHEPVIWIYGPTSFIASNIINNIPMSILFSTLPNGLDSINYTRAIYSSIIGSNIGAFFTPLGALAGIMFSSLVNKQNIKFTFLDFTKYGLIIALPTLFTALLTLFFII
jgi:arsenical pump membrane protein